MSHWKQDIHKMKAYVAAAVVMQKFAASACSKGTAAPSFSVKAVMVVALHHDMHQHIPCIGLAMLVAVSDVPSQPATTQEHGMLHSVHAAGKFSIMCQLFNARMTGTAYSDQGMFLPCQKHHLQ